MSEVSELEKKELVEAPKKAEPITSPEQWTAAVEVAASCRLTTLGRPCQFQIRPLSFAEETDIYKEIPLPQLLAEKMNDPEYLDQIAAKRFMRIVSIIDTCWVVQGKKHAIPGDTLDQKVTWFQENIWRGGEVPRLYAQILRLSGYDSSHQEEESAGNILMMSPDDWAKASQAPSVLVFERSGQPIAFRVTGIPGGKLKDIEKKTDAGMPPKEFKRELDGHMSKKPAPNPDNPAYKARVAELAIARNILTLEAGLGLSLPGKTMAEKSTWLGERPAGEVVELLNFLRKDVLAYREQADFF